MSFDGMPIGKNCLKRLDTNTILRLYDHTKAVRARCLGSVNRDRTRRTLEQIGRELVRRGERT
jgi:hypothetical protein